MADLRYRTFRMKVYARLCPATLAAADRDDFVRLLDRNDEDGMELFFRRVPADPSISKVLPILREARDIGDRLNVMDRTLPALPHGEIGDCYRRLRALANQVGELEAVGLLK
jgi:hypothetical protein